MRKFISKLTADEPPPRERKSVPSRERYHSSRTRSLSASRSSNTAGRNSSPGQVPANAPRGTGILAAVRRCDDGCPLREISSKLTSVWAFAYMAPLPVIEAEKEFFEYDRLKPWQTRLVKLQPASEDGIPSLELVTVDFIDMEGVGISATGEVVQYTALSYAWGASTTDFPIQCNGLPLLISRSLAQALQYLSRSEKRHYLWCDGICIDQNNKTEKAFQVAQMLRVFEKAESVLAWMGEVGQEALVALDQVQRHEEFVLRLKKRVTHTEQCETAWQTLQSSLASMLTQGIFIRTWIRQEFFAAKEVTTVWADVAMDFGVFHSGVTKIRAMPAPSFDVPAARRSSARLLTESSSIATPQYKIIRRHLDHAGTEVRGFTPPAQKTRYSIHWLKTLQDGSYFSVTDDRDRVYGVLGIIMSKSTKVFVDDRPEINPSNFPIDYNKTVSQVYQDVVKFLINTDRNLDALTIFENRRWQSDDLPSWVSDWRKQKPRGLLDIEPDTDYVKNSFGLATFQDMSEYGRLTLEGYQLGFLYALGPTGFGFGPRYANLKANLKASPSSFKEHSDLDSFADAVISSEYVHGVKVFESSRSNGYFPLPTSLNDVVVLFKGARCPFVLRELADGTFNFIGPVIGPVIAAASDGTGLYGYGQRDADWGFNAQGKSVWSTDPSKFKKFVLV